jgi:hypothetical protein
LKANQVRRTGELDLWISKLIGGQDELAGESGSLDATTVVNVCQALGVSRLPGSDVAEHQPPIRPKKLVQEQAQAGAIAADFLDGDQVESAHDLGDAGHGAQIALWTAGIFRPAGEDRGKRTDVPGGDQQVLVGGLRRQPAGFDAPAQPGDVGDDLRGIIGVGNHGRVGVEASAGNLFIRGIRDKDNYSSCRK